MCDDCSIKERNFNAKQHAKNNGTPRHYAQIRVYHAKRKNRTLDSNRLIPFELRFSDDFQHFKSILHVAKEFLHLDKNQIVFMDTEYDKTGGSEVHFIREYYFRDLSGNVLHIRRYLDDYHDKSKRIPNPSFNEQDAALQIHSFLKNYKFVIGYEPQNCDRNRVKSILNLVDASWYPSISNKFLDLKRILIDALCTTDSRDSSKVYLPALGLDDVWTHLLEKDSEMPPYFVQTDSNWTKLVNGVKDKCKWDVHRLMNVYMFIRNFYLS